MNSKKVIIEIRYHSLLRAMLIGVGLSSIYAAYLWLCSPSIDESVVSSSEVSDWIYCWQTEHEVLSYVLVGFIVAYISIKLGQIASRFNLYGVSSHLPMELYAPILMGVMINVSSLRMALLSLLILFSISRYMNSYKAANCAGSLLSGSLALGCAVLLYPPAILLWIVVPVMLILFDRTLREAIVATVALLFAPFTYLYIKWFLGGDFQYLVTEFISTIIAKSGFSIIDSFGTLSSIPSIIILVLILYMTIVAMFAISTLDNTVKAKRRVRLVVAYAIVSIAMIALPSADCSVFGLIAIPSSLLIPITMIRLRRKMAFTIYLALYIGIALAFCRFLIF